ncbi:4-amino-4-deoxy-L-arabinose transferase-like glycosyltransferase [Aeromonas hydrophila]|nr:4-amino-4-deoxy-L-arabinose transferase-like glycosyltransferase [Aeromonas hydrophila]
MQPTSTAPNTHLYGLLLMVLAITLMGQFGHQLWTPDEPREAAIAWEMFTSRELAIPTLGGSSFIEKPPLYYILTIPFLALLHDNLGVTVALRLVGALWAIATLLFTGLLARRVLGSSTAALLSVIALGTMEGFIMNSHWIRVDTSLAFFVAFTMWAFAEWYLAERQHMLWCAGLGLSLCFLVKGPIGPITLFFGWLALFLPALKRHLAHQEGGRFAIQHLGMTLLFVAPIAGWLLALWQHPEGESLWQQWFWQNQVGRLTGSSAELGHIKPGEYLFYLGGLAEYTLPWLPLVLADPQAETVERLPPVSAELGAGHPVVAQHRLHQANSLSLSTDASLCPDDRPTERLLASLAQWLWPWLDLVHVPVCTGAADGSLLSAAVAAGNTR